MSARDRSTNVQAQLDMLRWVADLGAVTAVGLALREESSETSARGRLVAAERRGLLVSHRLLRDQPTLYTATAFGIARCEARGLSPGRLSPAGARHAATCCAVAAILERTFPAQRLLGEPALRLQERRRGRPLASIPVSATGAGTSSHRPDMVLLDPAHEGSVVAIEVELTVKAPRRLLAICRGWARSRSVAGVVYVACAPVLPPLTRAIEAAGAGGKVIPLSLELLLRSGEIDGSLA